MRHLTRQNRIVQAQRCASHHARAFLSLVACLAILVAGGGLPADAQPRSKGMSEMFGELKKRKDFTGCLGKVQSAGYANAPVLGVTDSVAVNVTCDDGSLAGGLAPKGREQEILSVALAALSTGKSIQVIADDNRIIVLFGLIAGKKR